MLPRRRAPIAADSEAGRRRRRPHPREVEGRRPVPSSGRDARWPCGGSSSSGWKVSRVGLPSHRAEREEATVLALLARGSQQRTRKPHASAQILTSEPTCPTPTTPSVRSSGFQPWARETGEHGGNPLQHAAGVASGGLATSMPFRAHQSRSMWSNPMVAVAIIRTREPSRSRSSQRVRVRVTSASASRTSSRVISRPGRWRTSAKGSRTPFRNGMALSATIFMIFGTIPPLICGRMRKYR